MTRSRTARATASFLDAPTLRTAKVATVALLKPLDKPYSYLVPPELEGVVKPGMRVEIPFGRGERRETAFCLSVSEQPWDSTLKPVLGCLDQEPVLSEKLLELGRWIARYYCCHIGRTLDMMVPSAAKRHAGWKYVKYVTLARQTSPATQAGIRGYTTRQNAVLDVLRGAVERMDAIVLCESAGCTPATLTTLAKKGVIKIELVRVPIAPELSETPRHEPSHELTPEQKEAIQRISARIASGTFGVSVLFGVTGSGKTEVYIAAMRQALAENRQAILLVPEIALTTQTVQRLACRFDRVAVIHSGMSDVQRSRTWAAVTSGDIPVVIGTRSAVFAPCPNLGVIIVDEESEPSYKNMSAPRYHTRDAAITRAHLEGVTVVLGSAAPSLETWKNLKTRKHYELIRIRHRVGGMALPTVHLVDMHDEHHVRRGVHLLSREMEFHLSWTLERGEQAVLLLNRRGYASYLHCAKCRNVVTCPHCSVRMVFHATTELAHCHYCHARLAVPNRCSAAGCGGTLVRFGIGTQRVEQELRDKFPSARIRRMDSDVMQKPSDYAEALGGFERREYDILVGTQMIAKGLDFPFVSFVGVVSADTALALDDFRSEERTFQLVLQVSGRAGRSDRAGHVVVQTFASDSHAIRHAVQGDYEAFAEQELEHRRTAKLPPVTRMMRIVLADARMSRLREQSTKLREAIGTALERRGIRHSLFGPQACAIARLRDQYRYDLQLTFPKAEMMLRAIDVFQSEGTLKVGVRNLIVDVDPITLQ